MELDVTFRVSDLNLGGFKGSLRGNCWKMCVWFLPLPEKMHHFWLNIFQLGGSTTNYCRFFWGAVEMGEWRKVWLMKRILADAKKSHTPRNKSLHQLPCALKEHPGKIGNCQFKWVSIIWLKQRFFLNSFFLQRLHDSNNLLVNKIKSIPEDCLGRSWLSKALCWWCQCSYCWDWYLRFRPH